MVFNTHHVNGGASAADTVCVSCLMHMCRYVRVFICACVCLCCCCCCCCCSAQRQVESLTARCGELERLLATSKADMAALQVRVRVLVCDLFVV